MKEKYFLYMMAQHYMAHKTNLDVQALLNLPMVVKLEELLQSLSSYFSNSPQWHLEFTKLVKIVETRGLKILQNVKVHWISMLEPLKCVSATYKTLILKMAHDNASIVQVRLNLDLLCDVHTLLDLFYLLPFLKVVAQKNS